MLHLHYYIVSNGHGVGLGVNGDDASDDLSHD